MEEAIKAIETAPTSFEPRVDHDVTVSDAAPSSMAVTEVAHDVLLDRSPLPARDAQETTLSDFTANSQFIGSKRSKSRPSAAKPTVTDEERVILDEIVSHMELRVSFAGPKHQVIYRGTPRHSAEPIDIFQEFGDAANTGNYVDDEWQDVDLKKPGWWFVLHPSAPVDSQANAKTSNPGIGTYSQTDLLNFMHVRYEKERGDVKSRRRAPRNPPLQGDLSCSFIYRTVPLPSELVIPAPTPQNTTMTTSETENTSMLDSTDAQPTVPTPKVEIKANLMDTTPATLETPTIEDLRLTRNFYSLISLYESDSDVEVTENDINVVKKKASAQFRKVPTSTSERKPQPSFVDVSAHDLAHTPITIFEIPTTPFRIKLNPPLSNFRKRMISMSGTRLADIPIRTVYHADRSLFEEQTDSLLIVLKHSNVEGIILYVPLENLPVVFQNASRRVATEWAAYHSKRETRFVSNPEVFLINTNAPAGLRLSNNTDEWDDEYSEPALYPEQMTRRELREELEKYDYTYFKGANTFSLRKKLREFAGLPPDPNDGIGLSRRYQKNSERDVDDAEQEDEEDDNRDSDDPSKDDDDDEGEEDGDDLTSPDHVPKKLDAISLHHLEMEQEEEESSAPQNAPKSRKRKSPTARPAMPEIDDLVPLDLEEEAALLAQTRVKMDIDPVLSAIGTFSSVGEDKNGATKVNGKLKSKVSAESAIGGLQMLHNLAMASETSDTRKSSLLDTYKSPMRLSRKPRLPSQAEEDEDTSDSELYASQPRRKKSKYERKSDFNSNQEVNGRDAASRSRDSISGQGNGNPVAFPPTVDGYRRPRAVHLKPHITVKDLIPPSPEGGAKVNQSPNFLTSLTATFTPSLLSVSPSALPIPQHVQELLQSGEPLPPNPPRPDPATLLATSRMPRTSRIAARSVLAKVTREDPAFEATIDEPPPPPKRGRPPKPRPIPPTNVPWSPPGAIVAELMGLAHAGSPRSTSPLAEPSFPEPTNPPPSRPPPSAAPPKNTSGRPQRSTASRGGRKTSLLNSLGQNTNPMPWASSTAPAAASIPPPTSIPNSMTTLPPGIGGMPMNAAAMNLLYHPALVGGLGLATPPFAHNQPINGVAQAPPTSADPTIEYLHQQSLSVLPFLAPITIPPNATPAQYAAAMSQQHLAIMAALQSTPMLTAPLGNTTPYTMVSPLPKPESTPEATSSSAPSSNAPNSDSNAATQP